MDNTNLVLWIAIGAAILVAIIAAVAAVASVVSGVAAAGGALEDDIK